MTNIVQFPQRVSEDEIVTVKLEDAFAILTKQKTLDDIKWEKAHEARIKELMDMGVERLRHLWDNVSEDTSFYEGEFGMHDCADIHTALNRLGDGYYCAV
ncbi:MAG TPA: hypothetical protein DCP26_04490 [Brevundimonas sp.]|nr:hypothetical protein [Brevundimonas sp.]